MDVEVMVDSEESWELEGENGAYMLELAASASSLRARVSADDAMASEAVMRRQTAA